MTTPRNEFKLFGLEIRRQNTLNGSEFWELFDPHISTDNYTAKLILDHRHGRFGVTHRLFDGSHQWHWIYPEDVDVAVRVLLASLHLFEINRPKKDKSDEEADEAK